MKVAVILVMSLAGAAAVQAPRPATQTVCTLADLAGDFATQPQGILTRGPFAGPFASALAIHFDGNGRFTGIAASSF
jgi:hypothetical protein